MLEPAVMSPESRMLRITFSFQPPGNESRTRSFGEIFDPDDPNSGMPGYTSATGKDPGTWFSPSGGMGFDRPSSLIHSQSASASQLPTSYFEEYESLGKTFRYGGMLSVGVEGMASSQDQARMYKRKFLDKMLPPKEHEEEHENWEDARNATREKDRSMVVQYTRLKTELSKMRTKAKEEKGHLESFRTWFNTIVNSPPLKLEGEESAWRPALFPAWMEKNPGSALFAVLKEMKPDKRMGMVTFLNKWLVKGLKDGPEHLDVRARAVTFLSTSMNYERHLMECPALTLKEYKAVTSYELHPLQKMALSEYRDDDDHLDAFRAAIEGVGMRLVMRMMGAENEEVASKILGEYEDAEAEFHANLKKKYGAIEYITLSRMACVRRSLAENRMSTLSEVAAHAGLAKVLGLDPNKEEDAASLENLTKDWNSMIDVISSMAPESIGPESTDARSGLEIKEPDFKCGKLGEDRSRKISGPITKLKPFRPPQSHKDVLEPVEPPKTPWTSRRVGALKQERGLRVGTAEAPEDLEAGKDSPSLFELGKKFEEEHQKEKEDSPILETSTAAGPRNPLGGIGIFGPPEAESMELRQRENEAMKALRLPTSFGTR